MRPEPRGTRPVAKREGSVNSPTPRCFSLNNQLRKGACSRKLSEFTLSTITCFNAEETCSDCAFYRFTNGGSRGGSSKPDYDRIALAAEQRRRCPKAGRVKSRAVNISINGAARYRSDVFPACADNNQAVAADFLRSPCHEGNHSVASAADRCSFGIQITNYIIWPIWRTKENWHRIFSIYESACGDGPILLSPTVRREIRHSAAAEKHTSGQQQISLHARDHAIRVNQFCRRRGGRVNDSANQITTAVRMELRASAT
jgi:hypothetical protein